MNSSDKVKLERYFRSERLLAVGSPFDKLMGMDIVINDDLPDYFFTIGDK